MIAPNSGSRNLADELSAIVLDQARQAGVPFAVGVCGPQGSGKSTLVRRVGDRLSAAGLGVAVLSIDDLYLTRAERETLARDIHPLLITRGPPGTHDLGLGMRILEAGGPRKSMPTFYSIEVIEQYPSRVQNA